MRTDVIGNSYLFRKIEKQLLGPSEHLKSSNLSKKTQKNNNFKKPCEFGASGNDDLKRELWGANSKDLKDSSMLYKKTKFKFNQEYHCHKLKESKITDRRNNLTIV